ncbi:MAG: alpha/beta hydrolase [Actinomycetota bacterium]|nr:alpha/beta hydrolase [Actinomycetota bacterium]
MSLAAVDRRGRGDSGELPPPFGIDAHVRDMVAVLDALELERALVVGHSLGAYIAAALAATHPERVTGLVLVDGGLSTRRSPVPTWPPRTSRATPTLTSPGHRRRCARGSIRRSCAPTPATSCPGPARAP